VDWLIADLGYKRCVLELEPPGQPPIKRQSPACAVPEEELARLLTMRPGLTDPAYFVGWLYQPLLAGGQPVGWLLVELGTQPAPEERAVLDTALNQFRTCLEKVTYHQDILQLSILDGMTGIHNHRHFVQALKVEVARARRYAQPLALLLVDVDHFKKVNDQRGHLAGDAILKGLAARLKDSIRNIDMVARYGGEEFVVIAPQTDMKAAETFGERLRRRIADETFMFEDQALPVTVSIGVAETLSDTAESEEDLIRIADTRLYRAKEGGRNRVVAA
jgi:diguanylate cyclase (GGDEF)-like protein